jgi:hypothetical protein
MGYGLLPSYYAAAPARVDGAMGFAVGDDRMTKWREGQGRECWGAAGGRARAERSEEVAESDAFTRHLISRTSLT